MAGIRSDCTINSIDTSPFLDDRLYLFQRSLKYTRIFSSKTTVVIDTDLLLHILSVTETLQFPCVFKALCVHCFFSFLELSDILPHTSKTFDVNRQLCRGGLIFSQDVITIIIKCSKTLQT